MKLIEILQHLSEEISVKCFVCFSIMNIEVHEINNVDGHEWTNCLFLRETQKLADSPNTTMTKGQKYRKSLRCKNFRSLSFYQSTIAIFDANTLCCSFWWWMIELLGLLVKQERKANQGWLVWLCFKFKYIAEIKKTFTYTEKNSFYSLFTYPVRNCHKTTRNIHHWFYLKTLTLILIKPTTKNPQWRMTDNVALPVWNYFIIEHKKNYMTWTARFKIFAFSSTVELI